MVPAAPLAAPARVAPTALAAIAVPVVKAGAATVVVVGHPVPVVCTAPASQAAPVALAAPRWSVAGHRVTWLPPKVTAAGLVMSPMAGFPVVGAMVWVGPPLPVRPVCRSLPTALAAVSPG